MQNFSGDFVSLGRALLKYKGTAGDVYVAGYDPVKNTGYKTIRDYAFSGNVNIVKVTFGSGVVGIGSYTFSGCSNLQTVIFEVYGGVVPCGVEPFDLNAGLKIIVPLNALYEYMADSRWVNYIKNFKVSQSLVSFDPKGGSAVSNVTVYYGQDVYMPQSTKAGNTFLC